MKNKLIIISGADSYRYDAHINHQRYADTQGLDYKFHKSENLPNPFFTKCYAILDSFSEGYEYVLWIDDDAFFINFDWDCKQIFNSYNDEVIVVQGRPKKSGTTYFNNGIMFIRNTQNMIDCFSTIPKVSNEELKNNWNDDWGPCIGNDQPRMIYLTQTHYPDSVKILKYPSFNAHEISFKHYVKTGTDLPPIVHITGPRKEEKIKRFIQRTRIKIP